VHQEQVLKARGLRAEVVARAGALRAALPPTAMSSHEAHGARAARALPERVHRSVAILGPWATDLLARYHPPT
jgi:hypothetical protein